MTSQHAGQPLSLLGDGPVPAPLEAVIDLDKLGLHPFGDGDALEPELAAPALPADVREAQEGERFRLPEPPLLPGPRLHPAELDKAGLVGVQLQGELREPVAEVAEELLGVTLMLEPGRRSRPPSARSPCHQRPPDASSIAGPTGPRRNGGTRWRGAARPILLMSSTGLCAALVYRAW